MMNLTVQDSGRVIYYLTQSIEKKVVLYVKPLKQTYMFPQNMSVMAFLIVLTTVMKTIAMHKRGLQYITSNCKRLMARQIDVILIINEVVVEFF